MFAFVALFFFPTVVSGLMLKKGARQCFLLPMQILLPCGGGTSCLNVANKVSP